MNRTLISAIREHAKKQPNNLALRQKRYGIWEPMTWHTFYERIRAFALGLIDLGLAPDDKVLVTEFVIHVAINDHKAIS